MLLVADSGSTKCDWKYEGDIPKMSTMGFNPMFHNVETIRKETEANEELMEHAKKVKQLFFYGAGVSSVARKEMIKEALKPLFPNGVVIADHDLTAAAVATSGDDDGIACILGTGSNSCLYRNGQVYEAVPALGNRLGDEGSGSYFGRRILANFLYKRLPSYLYDRLKADGLTKEGIFAKVYGNPHENVYLASHMKVLSDFRDRPWVIKLVFEGLCDFIDVHVGCYPESKDLPINFVGSIAYYFKDILSDALEYNRMKLGTVVKQPIFNLLDYHQNQASK